MTTLASRAVRLPAVAGAFYPASKAALEAELDRLLTGAADARASHVSGTATACPKALVVPHAEYTYSGAVAASAYAELIPYADEIRRVVLLGPAHRTSCEGVVSAGVRWLRTPLGDVEVDTDALAARGVALNAAAHAHEHSVEVQLPFLQRVVPSARVVPLVAGQAAPADVGRVLASLWGGPETVIVVSSDLSHYLPYELAREVDARTAARIVALDAAPLRGDDACGAAALNGFLVVAREEELEGELLDLRSSGDTAGSRDEVVGYGAFAFR